jgi:undecaprenyl-diphosphatase
VSIVALLAAVIAALALAASRARRSPDGRIGRSFAYARDRGGPLGSRIVTWVAALGLRMALAIATSMVAIAAFASVAGEVVEQDTQDADARVRAIALGLRSPALDRALHAITWVGESAVLAVLVTVGAVLIAVRRHVRSALLAVVGPLLASVAIVGFKHLFQRARPEGALALGVHTYSFPSGHATASAASLLTLAYVLARERLLPWAALPVAAVAVLLIGASRVYLDAHWASDVLGGWAVGSGLALAGIALYERLRVVDRRHEAEHLREERREAQRDRVAPPAP